MVHLRIRLALAVAVLGCSVSLYANEVYLSIAGSVGSFRTDARIFNPSFTTDITVNASFLPAGNVSNAAVTPKAITIPKRKMVVYDDVVASLFATTGLGAIRLVSDGDFVATQRIYAVTADGTLGQFVPGLSVSAAKTKNVLIELKSNGAAGTHGTFRTNVGFVNPNATAANLLLTLYDKSNSVVGTAASLKIEPFGVVAPSNLATYFNNPAQDLSDAWLSVIGDLPVFAYGSVVDNGTTDPTFIPASEDTGVAPQTQPPGAKTVVVGPGFTFTPSELNISVGDTVTWQFKSTHTTTSDSSSSETWDSGTLGNGATFTHTFDTEGSFAYHCALHSVSGGTGMNGTIVVNAKPDGPPTYP